MSAFLLSSEADEDVWNIWRYLAEETGVSVANRIEAEFSFLPFISTWSFTGRASRWKSPP